MQNQSISPLQSGEEGRSGLRRVLVLEIIVRKSPTVPYIGSSRCPLACEINFVCCPKPYHRVRPGMLRVMTPVEQVLFELLHLFLHLLNGLDKSSWHKNGRNLDGIDGRISTGLPISEERVCRKEFCLVLLFDLDPSAILL